MRAQLSFPIFDFPSAWGDGPDDYISKGLNLRDDFKHSDLITIVFGPHSPYTVAHDKLGKVATLAAELDTAIHIHLQETADEIQQSIDNHQRRPLEIINDLGLLGPRSQCVHMTQVNESDLQLLSTTGAHVIHCPQSNMKLASGICPTPKLLDGAKAMGIDNRLGSLKQGKYADFIAVDLGNPATQPVHDCISQLVYAVNSRQVSHSWIAGKLMMENGKLTTLNTKQIVANAGHWQQKMTT